MRLLICLVVATSLLAQTAQTDRMSTADRMWISSRIYSTVRSYFGHWQAVPDLDFDKAYRRYVEQIAASDDRRQFDLATLELMAQLRNGHTDFRDNWLLLIGGGPVGFQLDEVEGKWVVVRSYAEGIEVGEEVVGIDGGPVSEFVQQRLKFVAGSDERARRENLFFQHAVWPMTFTLRLQGGREIEWNRSTVKVNVRALGQEAIRYDEGVAYHAIRSFGDPSHETASIEFLKSNASAKVVVLDVRGNGGGSSPERLLRAVMERPWRDWMQSSSMTFGLFHTYGNLYRNLPPKGVDERTLGFLEGFSEYFERPYFMTPGARKEPESPVYKEAMIVLVDRGCASACEDFLMPLKTTGRARLVGETTFGSSGQPYLIDFGNGMHLRVSTKRMYLPDGKEFEGVGIRPDVEVKITIEDLRRKRDRILEKAQEMAARGF